MPEALVTGVPAETTGYQDLAETTPQPDQVRAGDEGGGEEGHAEGQADPELERRAREIGWRPQEEWRGDPKKWKPADAFVAYHDSVLLPQKLWRENKELRLTQEQMKAELAELRKERQEETKRREELKRQSLEYERKQAMENGDHDRVAAITDELVDLKVSEKVAAVAPQRQAQLPDAETNRIWEGFVSDNPAFLNPDMQEVLTEQMTLMRQSGNTRIGREFLDRAKERVTRLYPEVFMQGKRRAMADMGGTPGNSGHNGKTWNDVRPDVREAYEQMIESSPSMAKDPAKYKAKWLSEFGPEQFRR